MEPRTGDLGMADWRRQILERFLLLDYVTKELISGFSLILVRRFFPTSR